MFSHTFKAAGSQRSAQRPTRQSPRTLRNVLPSIEPLEASSPTSLFKPTSRKARRVRPRSFRPLPIRLEERTLLSTVSWINPSGGDWDTPSNWSTGALPGPSDDVVIDTAGITVTHSSSAADSVSSLTISSGDTTLDISNGSLALATTSSVAGTVSLEGATLSTAGGLAVTGPFTNNGTVDVHAGTLSLSVGAPSHPPDAAGTGTITGAFIGAAGTAMYLGYQDLAATASVTGDIVAVSGQVRCPFHVSGTATLGQATTSITNPDTSLANIDIVVFSDVAFRTGQTITTGNLTVDAGSMLTGTDSFVVQQALAMPGDRLDTRIVNAGAGAMTIDAYGPVSITSGTLDGVTFNNHHTTTFASSDANHYSNLIFLDNTIFSNLAGATVTDDGGMYGSSNGNFAPGSGQFNNAGSYVVTAPGAFPGWFVPFLNTGSVDVQQGSLGLSNATNSGTVTLAYGTSLGAGSYSQTAGSIVLNGATINGGSLGINWGSLSGSGTINASLTNGGQLIPGGAGVAATLTVNGNYTQTATGTLEIDIGGTTAGSQYDQLSVSGTATLGGTLNVATIGSFTPAFGNTFQVLTFGSSSGNFATYIGPSLASGLFLDPVFGHTSLTLDIDRVAISGVPASPVPGVPINLTGTVTGPSVGNPSVFNDSWTVNQNGNSYSSGTGSTFSFMPNLSATYLVTLTVADATGGQGTTTLQVVVPPSIFVLNPTANAALSVSGGANITIPGGVVVDSSSPSAISLSGKSQLAASVIDVLGGVKTGTGSSVSPAPNTGVSIADPLAALTGPNPTGLTNYGSISLNKGSLTINPGIYSQIKVSNSASLTLNPGIYIIEGGGLTVTGSASIIGSGVMIYNAGSNYPSSGGKFSGITLSSTGTINLSAPTSGPYAGVLIFQSHENTLALSFSGNAMTGMSGTIYAPSALLSLTGSAQLQQGLVVGMLSVSGPIALTQTAAGSDGTGDASGVANTLLAGDLSVSINDPAGLFTADELARVQDAIQSWDAVLTPYNVTITEVSDPSLANLVIDIDSTGACGGLANGVLGCYNAANNEITILQGWNWYAGSDPSQIGATQYDFETTVLHELGHALGLGHSTNPSSPMYQMLATGVADRTVTTQDLNIPDPPAGADPQMAAEFRPGPVFGLSSPAAPVAAAAVLGPGPVLGSQLSVLSSHPLPAAGVPAGLQAGPEASLVVQGPAHETRRDLSSTGLDADHVVAAALADLVTGADPSRGDGADGTTEVPGLPAEGHVEDGTGTEPIRSDRIDPTGFARPLELPLRVRPVERGVIRPGLRSDVTPDERAAAVGWRKPMAVPGDPIARPANPREPGVALAKLAATLIVAGSWGHRARFRGVMSRSAGRPRDQKESE
jgi:hypothetical protein